MTATLAAVTLNPSFKFRILSSLIFFAEKIGLIQLFSSLILFAEKIGLIQLFSSLIFWTEKTDFNQDSNPLRASLPWFHNQYFQTKATGGRFQIWHDYAILIQEHFPWGVGFLGASTSKLIPNENVNGVSSSHSIILDVLSWSGILGLLLLAISALTVFIASLKNDLRYNHQSSLTIFFSVLLYSQTLPISTDKVPWLIMSIALGLALGSKETKV